MKLSRIVLEEFRKFRQPLALDGLQPGLNLFVGPNKAGKSTVAAAIRAAFLERYSTKTVADLAPRGESGARPSVELAFSHAGRDYVLKKQFLTKARCELLIDGGAERLDGEAAENALAALLGFDLPGRGQSKPEQAGIPGCCGSSRARASRSARRLATPRAICEALTRLSGELAAGDGDRLFERVSAERGALLDARNGKPRACSRMPMRRWRARGRRAMTLCAPRRSWTRTSTGWPPCARNMGRRSKPSPGRRWKRGPPRRARAWRPGARARDAGRLAPRAGAGRQQPGPVAGSGRARPAG